VSFLPEDDEPANIAALAIFKQHLGLLPRVFRAQMSRPDLVDSQAKFIETLLFEKGSLTRIQKEFILLAVSGANQNIYFPALFSQTLQFLGVKPEVSRQVTVVLLLTDPSAHEIDILSLHGALCCPCRGL